MRNKFVLVNDFKGLNITYSKDGMNWHFYRDPQTDRIANIKPELYRRESFIFTSVVNTPKGFFMYKTGKWPSSKHRLLFSKNGVDWKVIGFNNPDYKMAPEEDRVAGINKPKNINLAYDARANKVYLLITYSASMSGHYKLISGFTPKDHGPVN